MQGAARTTTKVAFTATNTKDRIQQVGVELFYKQGFRATTMRQITAACGLTPAAFYNHFQSKDELLYSIIVDAFAELERGIDLALGKKAQSCYEQLTAVIRVVTQFHCRKVHQAKVANRESLELRAEMLDRVLERRRSLRNTAEKIIIKGIEDGEFVVSSPPATVARLTSTAVFGLITSIPDWYIDSGPWTVELLVDLFVELAVRMVGGEIAVDRDLVD
jgi:TetR/AcrR family transcriptional regulator, cholesterol catabolism regulator